MFKGGIYEEFGRSFFDVKGGFPKYNGTEIYTDKNFEKKFQFNPSVEHIYLPDKDWNLFANAFVLSSSGKCVNRTFK
jgi:hypothetical protein